MFLKLGPEDESELMEKNDSSQALSKAETTPHASKNIWAEASSPCPTHDSKSICCLLLRPRVTTSSRVSALGQGSARSFHNPFMVEDFLVSKQAETTD